MDTHFLLTTASLSYSGTKLSFANFFICKVSQSPQTYVEDCVLSFGPCHMNALRPVTVANRLVKYAPNKSADVSRAVYLASAIQDPLFFNVSKNSRDSWTNKLNLYVEEISSGNQNQRLITSKCTSGSQHGWLSWTYIVKGNKPGRS